jgi:hypothetical protein
MLKAGHTIVEADNKDAVVELNAKWIWTRGRMIATH